jgi:hypothetical protein
MWLIVHLPQYIQLDEDYRGKLRLMEVLESIYNIPKDDADIERAKQQLQTVHMAVDESPELKAIMPQLEARYQARLEKKDEKIVPLSPEVEKFLRELGNHSGHN